MRDASRALPGLSRRALLLGAAATAAGCGSGSAPPPTGGARATTDPGPAPVRPGRTSSPSPPAPSPSAPAGTYTPAADDVLRDLKTVAGRFLEELSTYESRPGAGDVGELLRAAGVEDVARSAAVAAPLVAADRAVGTVRFVQLGGLVPLAESAGEASCMVVLEHDVPERDLLVRTVDVRCRRAPDGAWRVRGLASAGGAPPPGAVPADPAVRAVLDTDALELADSARWDVEAGVVDPRLLTLLDRLSGQWRITVTVLRNGHPVEVLDGRPGRRLSNHTRGRAVDIWALDGRPVHTLTQAELRPFLDAVLSTGPGLEVGAPFDEDGPGGAVFANLVHRDHLHVAFERATARA